MTFETLTIIIWPGCILIYFNYPAQWFNGILHRIELFLVGSVSRLGAGEETQSPVIAASKIASIGGLLEESIPGQLAMSFSFSS